MALRRQHDWSASEARAAQRSMAPRRAWVDENDPDNAWPRTVIYCNLRHHADTKWFQDDLGQSGEVVAQYLGDKLTTVLNHYVRAGT
jgi:hypothetical protein